MWRVNIGCDINGVRYEPGDILDVLPDELAGWEAEGIVSRERPRRRRVEED